MNNVNVLCKTLKIKLLRQHDLKPFQENADCFPTLTLYNIHTITYANTLQYSKLEQCKSFKVITATPNFHQST